MEGCLLILHQTDVDGQHIKVLPDFLAESLDTGQSAGVLLGGDNQFGRGEGGKCLVDALDVLPLEVVVIAEGQRLDLVSIGLQVEAHVLGRSDTRQEKDVLPP